MSPWVPGFGVFRAAAIADLGGQRGKLCRWGDRGGGWGAMAAGSVALVGRSLTFILPFILSLGLSIIRLAIIVLVVKDAEALKSNTERSTPSSADSGVPL